MWRLTIELIWIGFKSLFATPNRQRINIVTGIITYIIIPVTIIISSWASCVTINQNLISDILTIISIFLAITLGVSFIVPEKLSKRIEGDISQNESDVNARIRYKNFCTIFIKRLTFVLVLSVLLIILTIIMQIFPTWLTIPLSSIILGLFTLSILSILKLIIDIYIFLINDISET